MDPETAPPLKHDFETDQDAQDAHDLAMMGYEQVLTRKFNVWSMFSLAFCVLGMLPPIPCARRGSLRACQELNSLHDANGYTQGPTTCLPKTSPVE